ncbi:hybrid sensor histidine kinase/response regulator [Ancylobacter radicis]|uniref:histidine kinase n=1 Tax=Ancylobacter radicis TaxID=2836179 RepID=A0ABS5R7N1_9HYPH|nr:hybrid sensor histidine kinase/response regulator [Ancylobacter radicis]MBS9477678.1 response regulator [Ancylobacter radicis]
MSFNRLVFAFIIVVVLALNSSAGNVDDALRVMALYIPLALGVLAHILVRPAASRGRRIFALLLDCGFLSWQLHLGGEIAALFFPIYLWVIFGNGFRFGLASLFTAIPVATLSFAVVVWTTPFWRDQWHLSLGLLVGLIILPAYAGTLIRKLSAATKVAEEASQAKSLFLASVSHELRTPLTAIVGMTGLLRNTPLTTDQRDMVETVDVASRSLRTLIDGLLDLSRIEAGRMPVPHEPFDLVALLLDVRRLVEGQARDRGLSVSLHVTPRTPLRLVGSRQHVHEALVNLVGNAVKFTPQGGVTIAVDAEPAEDGRLTLAVEVSDTGIGIAQADQERIFEDFTQADASILNRFGGTGLGLAITRRLVALMGGAITVESEPGVGSTFRFHVPVEAAAAGEVHGAEEADVVLVCRDTAPLAPLLAALAQLGVQPAIADPRMGPARMFSPQAAGAIRLLFEPDTRNLALPAPSAGAPPPVLISPAAEPGLPPMEMRRRVASVLGARAPVDEVRRALTLARRLGTASSHEASIATPLAPRRACRLLLADDNRVNQRVFLRILEGAGHTVRVVENGEQALDLLSKGADAFDLVLMDFNMPEMDGLEASKLYRMMSTGHDGLPIVGLTADATALGDSRWREAGMDDCLIKPVEPAILLATIDRLMRGGEAAPPVGPRAAASRPHLVARLPALDEEAVESLRRLGGPQFAAELMEDYLDDAQTILARIVATARRGDLVGFRNEAHALQSSSANVGALALSALCQPWRDLRAEELRARADDVDHWAQQELARTRAAMAACCVRLRGLE